jgi:hypothetical protein
MNSFFNFGAKWGWCQLPTPAAVPPGKTAGSLCTGGWVGSRTGLNGYGKSRPHQDLIPGPFKT